MISELGATNYNSGQKEKTLVQKINAVMAELGAVEKKRENSAQHYKYMAHADLMKELHPLLIKNGLVIYPKRVRLDTCTAYQWPESGNPNAATKRQNRTAVEIHYIITDGVTDIEFGGIGEGVDSQDKSAYKAQTGAHKYALKGLFCIPDELDAEDERFEQMASPQMNGQAADAKSTQKAGKERAASILTYNQSGLISDKDLDKALADCKASKISDLSKDVADALIAKGLKAEQALTA